MRKVIIIIVLSILIIQCKKAKETNFLVAKNSVGELTSTTQVQDLDAMFALDSLVKHLGEGDFADAGYDEYLVYSKKGKHLLTIVPKEQHDSTATIEYVRIQGTQYKSATGLGLASTFKDVVDTYSVSKVEDAISVAQITIDELNATITIDKKELGIDDFGRQKIAVEQIPDMARLKTFTIWFD